MADLFAPIRCCGSTLDARVVGGRGKFSHFLLNSVCRLAQWAEKDPAPVGSCVLRCNVSKSALRAVFCLTAAVGILSACRVKVFPLVIRGVAGSADCRLSAYSRRMRLLPAGGAFSLHFCRICQGWVTPEGQGGCEVRQ